MHRPVEVVTERTRSPDLVPGPRRSAHDGAMIQVASRGRGASSSCSRPISLAVLSRRTDERELPVMVYTAVVPGLRGFGGAILKPHQILGYLADSQV
jgi:hypothetical protein